MARPRHAYKGIACTVKSVTGNAPNTCPAGGQMAYGPGGMVCCHPGCSVCGKLGCGASEPGGNACCFRNILKTQPMCSENGAKSPCVLLRNTNNASGDFDNMPW
eukprot:4727247-Pyramimonas_sp.AAC.1